MVLFCENTTAIEIANNPIQHDPTKHIELHVIHFMHHYPSWAYVISMHQLESQGRKPNSFQFPRVINSGKHSCDRVSFWSPSPDPKAFRRSNRRQKTFTAGDFSANFPAMSFSDTQGAPGGDLQFFPKHRSQKTTTRAGHARFSGRHCISRAAREGVSHFPATRFLLQPRLTD
ncbi:hypothetical protein CK203_048896 [Vitis vinifera]|uniref:Uncharacterized protein n=1 Tax=Vitis vinifera TaxID=29760 RepID=A0A438FKU9_VITVI|nr:hypothetical protein CK203_048896 [Vitis vinifera]